MLWIRNPKSLDPKPRIQRTCGHRDSIYLTRSHFKHTLFLLKFIYTSFDQKDASTYNLNIAAKNGKISHSIYIQQWNEVSFLVFISEFYWQNRFVGNVTAAKELDKNGEDINLASAHGWTPLLSAVWNRNTPHWTWNEKTLRIKFHFILSGRVKMVEWLIRKGAQLNCSLDTGWTPLGMY